MTRLLNHARIARPFHGRVHVKREGFNKAESCKEVRSPNVRQPDAARSRNPGSIQKETSAEEVSLRRFSFSFTRMGRPKFGPRTRRSIDPRGTGRKVTGCGEIRNHEAEGDGRAFPELGRQGRKAVLRCADAPVVHP